MIKEDSSLVLACRAKQCDGIGKRRHPRQDRYSVVVLILNREKELFRKHKMISHTVVELDAGKREHEHRRSVYTIVEWVNHRDSEVMIITGHMYMSSVRPNSLPKHSPVSPRVINISYRPLA